jgi:hypothetical protein
MEVIDNVSHLLGDSLKQTIAAGSKLRLAADPDFVPLKIACVFSKPALTLLQFEIAEDNSAFSRSYARAFLCRVVPYPTSNP